MNPNSKPVPVLSHPLRPRRSSRTVWAALLSLAFAFPAFADAEMDVAHVKYRQALMSGVGANMGGISTILKNRLVMPGHIESHARQIAESAKLISSAFKAEVTTGDTDAKAKIWKDHSGFQDAIAKLEKASNDLAAAAAGNDPATVGPAVKALGKSCGGCHKAYRKPKEESYKNR